MMSKYMEVIWLYLIGIVIIFVGVFLLMSKAGPSSFIVMLVGLAIAALGAAHGRRMRMMGQFDIQQFMRERGIEVPKETESGGGAQPSMQATQQRDGGREGGYEKALQKGVGSLMGAFRREQSPADARGMVEEEAKQMEMDDIKKGKLMPTEADVVELVCPMCSSDNDSKNYFCFSCGHKLRRKPIKEEKAREPMVIEPGSVRFVGEKRVAKVIVCPKCNTANKETDKFCHNCGHKLKAERGSRE